MAGKTPNYGLTFFDYRDRLDSSLSVKMETDRFLTIDKQLYGMYSIFGNGVIYGLRVRKSSDDPGSIEIDPGMAFVNLMSGELKGPYKLSSIQVNSVLYVFCTITGSTQKTRRLKFFTSESPSHSSSVRISKIQTIGSEVRVIDNTYKQEISFKEKIKEEIANHRHTGIPSKIDLAREVKNQLPGARIESLSVDQIQSGRFGIDRIPQLDHDNLKNNGLLSHSALDSLAKNLQINNRQILGEVASVNLLRQQLFDVESSMDYLNSAINTVAIIPGKTPEGYIDYDISTAKFKGEGTSGSTVCSSGESSVGFQGSTTTVTRVFDIKYEDNIAFNLASYKRDIVIAQNRVTLALGDAIDVPVEQFEGVDEGGVAYPGVSIEEEAVESEISVVSDASVYVQGLYSGKFSSGSTSKVVYKKTVTQNKDWSTYDLLTVRVQCSSESHPPVSFAFANSGSDDVEVLSEKFTILSTDEVTTNSDPSQNNFKTVSVDVSSFDRGNVTAIYFYIPNAYEIFSFNIDDIKLLTTAKYFSNGEISFRYSSGSSVVLESIVYTAETPEDSAVELTVRTGNSLLELEQATWTGLLVSGAELNLSGVEFEVNAKLKSSTDEEYTPSLSSVIMRFLISTEIDGDAGFGASRSNDFLSGELENAQINQNASGDSSYISIATPIEVMDMHYVHGNAVHQMTPDFDVSFGYGGVNLPISPNQAANYSTSISNTGLDGAVFARRLINKNFLVCDTYNDRVVEVDRNLSLVRGYGGHYAGTTSGFFPMSAIFNPRTGILQVCFSQEAEIDPVGFNLTGITVHVGQNFVNLSSRDEFLQRDLTRRIMEIRLSQDKAEEIVANAPDVFIEMPPGIFMLEEFYESDAFINLYSSKGLKVDVVDFTYKDGIVHPICAAKSEHSDKWYISNSGIPFDRIRAGLRDDTDEFFTIPGTSVVFSIIVSLSEELQQAGAVVTFLNDSSVSDNIPVFVTPNTYSGMVEVETKTNLKAEVVATPTGEDLINGPTFIFKFTVKVEVFDGENLVEVSSSPWVLERRLTVLEAITGQPPSYPDVPSLVRMNLNTDDLDFHYGGIGSFTFNDFTLGSVEEVDPNTILISGIRPFDSGTEPPIDNVDPDSFEGQAIGLLKEYKGSVMVLSVDTKNPSFVYDSQDGLYASDANFDDNSNIVVAESSIIKNVGRIIKIDPFGNIVASYGGNQFTIINNAKPSGNGNILIST